MNSTNQKIPNSSWLKTFSIGFSIISFGITIAIIGYIVLTTKQTQPANQQPISISPTIAQPSTTPSNETANWKTYIDPRFGYSFKHPSDWTLTYAVPHVGELASPDRQLSMGGELLTGGDIIIIFKQNSSDLLSLPFNSDGKLLNATIIKKEKIIVDNYPATRYEIMNLDYQSESINVLIKRNKDVYQISASYGKNEKRSVINVFDQILSTFKFTNQ